jgi:predicted phosphodiesterase
MLEDLANIPAHNHERKKAAPKESWRPHLDIDPDKGGYFVSSPRTPEESPDHAELLAEFDLNPDDWRVLNVRRSKWQSFNGEWLEAFRVNIAPQGAQSFGVDAAELEKEIAKWRPPKNVKPVTGDLTAIFASGDTQWGKDAGDGSEGTVRRVRQGITESVERFKEIKGRGIGQIALPQLGDCIEGTVSQGGKIVGRLDLPITAQIRVGRRILLEWVKAFAPYTEDLIIPVVPGNHDEPHRTVLTDPMDSWQVEIVQQVLDICAMSDDLQHVRGIFAERDNSTLTVNMSGTTVGMIHGHQSRDLPKWWSTQSLGRTPIGEAEVLLSAHYHHYRANQVGPNLWVQIPAMDGGSPWFRDRVGLDSPPGIVAMVVGEGYDPRRDLTVLAGR